jgi:hypothetical protein
MPTVVTGDAWCDVLPFPISPLQLPPAAFTVPSA